MPSIFARKAEITLYASLLIGEPIACVLFTV
jgi:hypothetical protein